MYSPIELSPGLMKLEIGTDHRSVNRLSITADYTSGLRVDADPGSLDSSRATELQSLKK